MKRMQTWRWVLAALLLALAVTARAWQPAGWTYWDWPWTYDSASGDWHWFAAGGAQWIYAYPPGTSRLVVWLCDVLASVREQHRP